MYPIIFRFASELRWGEAWRWSKGQIRQNSIFGYFSSVAALLILMKIDSKQVFKVVHKFIFFIWVTPRVVLGGSTKIKSGKILFSTSPQPLY